MSGSRIRNSSSTVCARISSARIMGVSACRVVGHNAPVTVFSKMSGLQSVLGWSLNSPGYRDGRYFPKTKLYSSRTAE